MAAEPFHGTAQQKPDAFLPQFGLEEGRHIRVKRIHQLPGPLNNGDCNSEFGQIFRQLQADEAAAGQNCGFGVRAVDKPADPQHVLHSPQGEQPVRADMGEIRLHRDGAG